MASLVYVDFVVHDDDNHATWRSRPRVVHSTEDHRNVADVRRA